MDYQGVENMELLFSDMQESQISSEEMMTAVVELINKSNSWEKCTVVEKLSGYLQEKFDEGILDFKKLTPRMRLLAARIMYSPKEYTEDVLLGKTPRLGMEFIFPYHLFPRGSRVAIYGAGNTSPVIYRQTRRDKYLKIVGIFDQNLTGTTLEDMIVRPVRDISQVDCDYILIAICEEKTAEKIKNRLTAMGIPARKIRWDGDVYHRDDFYRNLYIPMVETWNGSRESHESIIKEYNSLLRSGIFDHVFPYHLFNEGERVVIYGAGDIGRKFWKQGKAYGFVELVGIVDRNADNIEVNGIPVENVSAIEKMEFDSILISVHGPENIIQQIQEMLEDKGVDKERIKWDGRTYHQGEFRRNVYLNMVRAIGSGFKNSTQMLGNLCRCVNKNIYEYEFPYEFFRKGERVVIYGAGKIGKSLYRQARRYGYVDVVAIVDIQITDSKDIPVLPLEAVMKVEMDSVLIAEMGHREAEKAKNILLSRGIAKDKILWPSYGYGRDAYNKRRIEKLLKRTEAEIDENRIEGLFEECKEE